LRRKSIAKMAKHNAESWDASGLETYLHEQGHSHLRVRRHGDLLIIESGPEDDPIKHARLRRSTVHLWTLEMATHTGKFQPTGLRGLLDEIKDALVHDFGWVLTPIE